MKSRTTFFKLAPSYMALLLAVNSPLFAQDTGTASVSNAITSTTVDNSSNNSIKGQATNEKATKTAIELQEVGGKAVTNEQAMEALNFILGAQAALKKKDLRTAKESINNAINILSSIEDSLPTAKMAMQLSKANDSPENADWIDIYQQLDQIVLFLPQSEIKNLKSAIKKQKSTKSAEGAKPQSPAKSGSINDKIEAVLVALSYTEVDLPVKKTIASLNKAATALNKEDIKSATKELNNAEQDVVVIRAVAQDPLFMAHVSIWQALANLKAESITDAKSYFNSAVTFLKETEKSSDVQIRKAADALLKKANTLKADLDSATNEDKASLEDKIEHLGLQTEAWAERAINYASVTAGTGQTTKLKKDLIEARFYLTNAKIDLLTNEDSGITTSHLDQAKTFLDKAIEQKPQTWLDTDLKTQVTEIRKKVSDLTKGASKPEEITNLETYRQSLQEIIHKL